MLTPTEKVGKTSAQRLAELFMIAPSERRWRSLMIAEVHNGFFDESGTHDGSEVVSVAGLVSTYEGWERWELDWRRILASRRINVFHFTDFMARKREFDNDWSDPERDHFMSRLCRAISDNIAVGISCSVFREEYDACLPLELRQQIRHPYYFGLYMTFLMLQRWDLLYTPLAVPAPLRLLFDRKKGYEGFASAIYYSLLDKFEEWGWDASKIGDLAFGSKEADIPLQAADLLVGVTRRHFLRCRRRDLSPQHEFEKSLLALGESRRLAVLNAGPEELKDFAFALGY